MMSTLKSKSKYVTAFICLLISVCSGSAQGQLLTLETDHLRLIYFGKAHAHLVSYAARCFENSYSVYHRLYEYAPEEKVTLALHDFGDYGTAGTGTVPKNHITMTIAPTNYVFETYPASHFPLRSYSD